MINISEGITKFEKLIASWEHLKTKVTKRKEIEKIQGATQRESLDAGVLH